MTERLQTETWGTKKKKRRGACVPVPCPTFQRRKASRANNSSPNRMDRTMIHHGTPPCWASSLSGNTVSLTWGRQIQWQKVLRVSTTLLNVFFFPINLYDAHKTDVSVCTTLPSAFEFSCNAVNNHDCFGLPVSQNFAEPCSLFCWQHSERPSLPPPHDVMLNNPV